MKTPLHAALLLSLAGFSAPLHGACCYFAAKDKDIQQPSQKVFITWQPDTKKETFTVQPKFEGNAKDFGMVIPVPARPKLDEMPRDFFKSLAVFTILEPMDEKKFSQKNRLRTLSKSAVPMPAAAGMPREYKKKVTVLEAGVVGNLDYKIIEAEASEDLFQWLKDNGYSYGGDEGTLKFYIDKKWLFTVMKIDPSQMREGKSGANYAGEITPTRFTFTSEKPVYPLRITQISVKEETEALFYIQAPWKTDFTTAPASYQHGWQPMFHQAMDMAEPTLITATEKTWIETSKPQLQNAYEYISKLKSDGFHPATLEWAKKLTPKDLGMMTGSVKYDRDAPAEDVGKMRCLQGHLAEGQFVTKIRKVFRKGEMSDDLEITRAGFNHAADPIEYFSILPTSPP